MNKEEENWINRSKKDLKSAEDSFNSKNYEWSCFQAQQAVEKAFKALLIKRTGEFPKIHDLVRLGKDVEIPETFRDGIKELTLAYTYTRYPDVGDVSNLEQKAANFLRLSKEILKWVEKNL